ncbi:hypothetical protein SRB17_76420 [Streptomyces sp. RB17]|nr:hypothetical protein [Streptomyces sp. RB17]
MPSAPSARLPVTVLSGFLGEIARLDTMVTVVDAAGFLPEPLERAQQAPAG